MRRSFGLRLLGGAVFGPGSPSGRSGGGSRGPTCGCSRNRKCLPCWMPRTRRWPLPPRQAARRLRLTAARHRRPRRRLCLCRCPCRPPRCYPRGRRRACRLSRGDRRHRVYRRRSRRHCRRYPRCCLWIPPRRCRLGLCRRRCPPRRVRRLGHRSRRYPPCRRSPTRRHRRCHLNRRRRHLRLCHRPRPRRRLLLPTARTLPFRPGWARVRGS